MLIITNRRLSTQLASTGIDGTNAFGESENIKGINEIRLAWANKHSNQWTVELVPEKKLNSPLGLPSRQALTQFLKDCQTEKKHGLFFVHGFNTSFEESLEHADHLEKTYGVKVILFSWPSNSGGIPMHEYKKAKRAALASAGALDNILEKISEYMSFDFNKKALLDCHLHFNFMSYSLGCFLFKSYAESSFYDNETRMFTNLVLCQADCDNSYHWQWIDRVQASKRIYITINENDKILGWSDANFQKDRLGRTARDLNTKNGIYIDVTKGKNIGNTHRIWSPDESKNPDVTHFFQSVFNGERAEELPCFRYDARTNRFLL